LQEGSDYKEPSHDTLNCALEEDELEKLLVQNSLGCDLYMRKFVDNFEQVECLPKDGNHLVHLPPSRFPDRFIDVTDPQPSRHFVAIHVSEARVQTLPTLIFWTFMFCSSVPMCLYYIIFGSPFFGM